MDQTPDKGPIRHLQLYLKKYEKEHSLTEITQEFPNINKWTNDTNIDKETSNGLWSHPDIIDSQITCILKFRYNQYMGNARKQLFFGPALYPNITCPICNSPEPDTWKYVLLSCIQQQYIHALRINKAVWEICRLITQHKTSRCYILLNAGPYNGEAPQNIVPPWLLEYTYINTRYHCLAKLKPDMLCVQDLPYQSNPPTTPDHNITIQFIEFTYCNDRFSPETIAAKINKYQSLHDELQAQNWTVATLMVLTTRAI
jgi:hypothetical protein